MIRVDEHAPIVLRDIEPSPIQETLEKGQQLISPRLGIIRRIGCGTHFEQDIKCFSIGASRCTASALANIADVGKSGGGGQFLVEGLASAVGEAVERYCMLFFDKEKMVLGSYKELKGQAVHPDVLRLYSKEQIENKPRNSRVSYFDENTRTYWTWAFSLTNQCWKLVPGPLVYLGYIYDKDEDVTTINASSGLAAGNTLEEAVLTGIYELIERDGFSISWLRRHVNARVISDVPEVQTMLEERFQVQDLNVEINIFDVTMDLGISAMFCYVRRPSETGPVLCVGSAARLNPVEAVKKVLVEAGQGMPFFRFLNYKYADWEPRTDFKNLTDFDHHAMFYLKRQDLIGEAFSFCEEAEREVQLSKLPARGTGRILGDINQCVAILEQHGYEVLVADITTPDVAKVGFKVVRVLIPGLMPMHGNHNGPYLGVQRYWEIPEKMRWAEDGWSFDGAKNPYPHPFP